MKKLLLLTFLGISLISRSENSALLFYNVENLFDTMLDSINTNKEYLPTSKKKWSKFRYYQKINQLSQVIFSSKDSLLDSLPAIIGLAEVESKTCLADLVNSSLLKKEQYEIIHQDSPDRRGIDVALLYKSSIYDPIAFKWQTNRIPKIKTRDFLIFTATHKRSKDTICVVVNHWPSRYGGKKKSQRKRILSSLQLCTIMDSLKTKHPKAYHFAMGDFNDEVKDSSLLTLLTKHPQLTYFAQHKKGQGTIKYKRKWQNFDLIFRNNVNHVKSGIFAPNWLLEEDKKFGGLKPFRSFYGPQFHGGISDHLPVFTVIKHRSK